MADDNKYIVELQSYSGTDRAEGRRALLVEAIALIFIKKEISRYLAPIKIGVTCLWEWTKIPRWYFYLLDTPEEERLTKDTPLFGSGQVWTCFFGKNRDLPDDSLSSEEYLAELLTILKSLPDEEMSISHANGKDDQFGSGKDDYFGSGKNASGRIAQSLMKIYSAIFRDCCNRSILRDYGVAVAYKLNGMWDIPRWFFYQKGAADTGDPEKTFRNEKAILTAVDYLTKNPLPEGTTAQDVIAYLTEYIENLSEEQLLRDLTILHPMVMEAALESYIHSRENWELVIHSHCEPYRYSVRHIDTGYIQFQFETLQDALDYFEFGSKDEVPLSAIRMKSNVPESDLYRLRFIPRKDLP